MILRYYSGESVCALSGGMKLVGGGGSDLRSVQDVLLCVVVVVVEEEEMMKNFACTLLPRLLMEYLPLQ